MHAEKVRAKIVRAPGGKLCERNAAGVRSDHRARPAMLFEFFVEAALDVEIFDDRFDDQITIFQAGQIVFKVAD